jgi:hypothetical protein
MVGQPVIVTAFANPDQVEVWQQVHVKIEAAGKSGPFVEVVPAVEVHPAVRAVMVNNLPCPPQGKTVEGGVVNIHTVDRHISNHPVETGNIKVIQPAVGSGDNRQVILSLEFSFLDDIVPCRYIFFPSDFLSAIHWGPSGAAPRCGFRFRGPERSLPRSD